MQDKRKREIKSINLVLDLSKYHPNDSNIEHEWADEKKRSVEQIEEFCFAQVKFDITHLSGNELMNKWINKTCSW